MHSLKALDGNPSFMTFSFPHTKKCPKCFFPFLPLEKESGVKISVEKRPAVAAVGENMEIVR